MPVVTVDHPVTLEDEVARLQERLGEAYAVTPRRQGSEETIGVRRALQDAHVRVVHTGDTTMFKVHGSGLIWNRLMNEMSIARRVAAAIKEA